MHYYVKTEPTLATNYYGVEYHSRDPNGMPPNSGAAAQARFALKMMDFVPKMRILYRKMMDFVLKMMDFFRVGRWWWRRR